MKCDGKAEFSVSHAPQKSFYNADLWLYFCIIIIVWWIQSS